MPILETWAQVLVGSFERLWYDIAQILPNIVVAIVLLILGWVVGAGLSKLISQIIKALRVDAALRTAGVEGVVERAGYSLNAGEFLGTLVKWFVIAVFLVAALEVLHLPQVTIFLSQIVFFYLPQVIVAVVILLIGAVLAEFTQGISVAAAKTADIGSPYFVGSVARWSIWIFAILAALNQLEVATAFVQTLFTGIVVAISLALGLAFGLGGQAAAARYIDRVAEELRHKRN